MFSPLYLPNGGILSSQSHRICFRRSLVRTPLPCWHGKYSEEDFRPIVSPDDREVKSGSATTRPKLISVSSVFDHSSPSVEKHAYSSIDKEYWKPVWSVLPSQQGGLCPPNGTHRSAPGIRKNCVRSSIPFGRLTRSTRH